MRRRGERKRRIRRIGKGEARREVYGERGEEAWIEEKRHRRKLSIKERGGKSHWSPMVLC